MIAFFIDFIVLVSYFANQQSVININNNTTNHHHASGNATVESATDLMSDVCRTLFATNFIAGSCVQFINNHLCVQYHQLCELSTTTTTNQQQFTKLVSTNPNLIPSFLPCRFRFQVEIAEFESNQSANRTTNVNLLLFVCLLFVCSIVIVFV